jgi:hypothetical protein
MTEYRRADAVVVDDVGQHIGCSNAGVSRVERDRRTGKFCPDAAQGFGVHFGEMGLQAFHRCGVAEEQRYNEPRPGAALLGGAGAGVAGQHALQLAGSVIVQGRHEGGFDPLGLVFRDMVSLVAVVDVTGAGWRFRLDDDLAVDPADTVELAIRAGPAAEIDLGLKWCFI